MTTTGEKTKIMRISYQFPSIINNIFKLINIKNHLKINENGLSLFF